MSAPRTWATPFAQLTAWQKAQLLVATSGGVGMVAPFAPGTFGTLPAVPLAWALDLAGPWAMGLGALLAFAVGVAVSKTAITATGLKDPGVVTIDEVAGYLIALIGAPVTPGTLLAAFLLFRFFDIAKPWPIRRFEQLPGAWGVLVDDVVAGLLAALCLQALLRFAPGWLA